jgi:hypothetical protein
MASVKFTCNCLYKLNAAHKTLLHLDKLSQALSQLGSKSSRSALTEVESDGATAEEASSLSRRLRGRRRLNLRRSGSARLAERIGAMHRSIESV